jgi:hypothetical protein
VNLPVNRSSTITRNVLDTLVDGFGAQMLAGTAET